MLDQANTMLGLYWLSGWFHSWHLLSLHFNQTNERWHTVDNVLILLGIHLIAFYGICSLCCEAIEKARSHSTKFVDFMMSRHLLPENMLTSSEHCKNIKKNSSQNISMLILQAFITTHQYMSRKVSNFEYEEVSSCIKLCP